MPDAPHILVVDDDADHAAMVVEFLRLTDCCRTSQLDTANAYDQANRMLRANDYQLAFVDYWLGARDGLSLLREIRQAGIDTPVVVLTGRADRTTGLAAIERGAQAYVLKGWEEPNDLVASIKSAVSRRSALSELASVTDRMRTADERLRKIGPESRAKKA